MTRRKPKIEYHQVRGKPVVLVELTRGKTAIVDPGDWSRVSAAYGECWQAIDNGQGRWSARKEYRRPDGRMQMMTLGRAVMNATDGDRVEADNGNALDCRRCNLSRIPKHRTNERRQSAANQRWRDKLTQPNDDKEAH